MIGPAAPTVQRPAAGTAERALKRGRRLLEGGPQQDLHGARAAFEEAATAGSTAASYELGRLLVKPPFLDFPAAAEALERAANGGHTRAAVMLGELHEGHLRWQSGSALGIGRQVPKDRERAIRAYRIAVNAGDADATWQLAHCMAHQEPFDLEAVTAAYERAIEADPRRIEQVMGCIFCTPKPSVPQLNAVMNAAYCLGYGPLAQRELIHTMDHAMPDRAELAGELFAFTKEYWPENHERFQARVRMNGRRGPLE